LKQLSSSENKKSLQDDLNKSNLEINRGFEFILNGGKKKQVKPVSFVFDKIFNLFNREIPRPHPEMFDPNGNLVPDEIVAFRFENNYDNDSEEEDD